MIAPRFSGAEPFRAGLSRVWEGDRIGYIDASGGFVWKPSR